MIRPRTPPSGAPTHRSVHPARRSRRAHQATLGVALLAATAIGVGCSSSDGQTAKASGPVIARVIDGDTVVVRADTGDETVRLIGVDTPETKHPSKPVQCFGKEATAFTTSLLPEGTSVRLERDVEERDRYGRLLAYVYRADDGVFVNLELARQGFADVLTIAPNVAHSTEFVAAVGDARTNQRGLWTACDGFGVPADP
jgi:micrococcal nuclease